MNNREMNPLERHVEKIVLAIAAAGAIYMGYLAIQPVTIDDNGTIAVENVEKDLSEKLNAMDATADANKNFQREPTVGVVGKDGKVTPYEKDYAQLIDPHGNPLPQEVLTFKMPIIGPPNISVGPGGGPPALEGDWKVVTPAPAAPEFLSVEPFQRTTMTGPPAVAGVLPPGTPPAPGVVGAPTKDQNAAVIQGYIPVSKMLVEMALQKQANKARLPDPLQHVVIAKIEVERKDKTLGSTTDWQPVPQPKSPVDDIIWANVVSQEDLAARMTEVDGYFKQVVIPDAFRDETGAPIAPSYLTKAKLKPVTDREAALTDELKKVPPPGVPNPPGTPMIITPSGPAPGAAPVDNPGGDVPVAANPGMPADVAAVKNQPLVPFVVWDDTVIADHDYQYRVKVDYVNPTYNWQLGLANPAMKLKETLSSDWVVVPNTVRVKSDLVYFVTASGGLNRGTRATSASFIVFKRSGGKWYQANLEIQPGMAISGVGNMVDPAKPPLDVDTGLVLVDADSSKNNETRVVMVDPTGRLTTKVSVPSNDPDLQGMIKSAEHIQVTTKPTPPPQTLPAGRNPTPGRGGTPRGTGTPGGLQPGT